jgi:hypothetical protein
MDILAEAINGIADQCLTETFGSFQFYASFPNSQSAIHEHQERAVEPRMSKIRRIEWPSRTCADNGTEEEQA